MHLTQRDVGGLVFGEQQLFVAAGDFGRAADDHPVLGTVVVFLQTQAGLGVDLNSLDLEATTFVDAVVPAQGRCTLR